MVEHRILIPWVVGSIPTSLAGTVLTPAILAAIAIMLVKMGVADFCVV